MISVVYDTSRSKKDYDGNTNRYRNVIELSFLQYQKSKSTSQLILFHSITQF